MAIFKSINPYTNEVISEFETITPYILKDKIENGFAAFTIWKNSSVEKRVSLAYNLSQLLQKNKEKYAKIITSEMGKPITEALAEVEKCAMTCAFYSEKGSEFLKEEIIQTEAKKTYVTHQPLGVILGVMPWNFPFWQVIRFALPTIFSGNAVLLKHAPNVLGCALAIEEAFLESGFHPHLFQNIIVDVDAIESIVADTRVKGVSLTGSERAGRSIAILAGKYIKPVVLELGGNDPFIVLKDADINKAVEVGLRSRMQNAGQVCISAKRFILEKEIKESFVQKLCEKLKSWQPGNPALKETKMGPMARLDLAKGIEDQYNKTIAKGAISLTGFNREGCKVTPVILDQVPRDSVAFCEETFGPLAAIIEAKNEEEAIILANHSRFGLAGTVFSQNLERAEKIGLQLNVGMVFINEQVRSDPRYPIGGINNSGFGRELSHYGLHAFTNAKVVLVK